MTNAIKYNTSTESLSIRKNNFWIGTGDSGKGPTSSTGFYNGITPPSGGYTIYLNKVSGGPSIYTCTTDAELISLTNIIAGASYTTKEQCFVYFAGQTDKMVVNKDYPSIVTNGLVMQYDASYLPSYPQTGTSFYSNSFSATTGSLYNGIAWGDYGVGGAFLFDGIDDAITLAYTGGEWSYLNEPFSLCVWVNKTQTNPQAALVQRGLGSAGGAWYMGLTNGTQIYLTTQASGTTTTTQYSTTNVISNNTWYYVVSTYDNNGNAKLYCNGVDVTGTPVTMVRPNASSYVICYNLGLYNCMIGGYKEYFKGYMSQHSGYNRELTAAEVLQNFNATKSRFGY